MLLQLKALDLLMKFFLFALCLKPVLAYPANPTDDGLTTLEKRTLNPPLPTVQEAWTYKIAAQGHSKSPDIPTLQKSIPMLPY